MNHDPMCPDGLSSEHCCDVVAEIRADERLRLLWLVNKTIEHHDNCNLYMYMDGGCNCGKNDLLDLLMGKL